MIEGSLLDDLHVALLNVDENVHITFFGRIHLLWLYNMSSGKLKQQLLITYLLYFLMEASR